MLPESNAFFSAIKNGNKALVEEMLNTDIKYLNMPYGNKNSYDELNGKSTPLIFAIHNGQVEIAKTLLLQGADPNLGNSQGTTALQEFIIQDYKHQNVNGYKDIISMLLSTGANPNIQNKYGNTALMIVANECFKHYDNSYMVSILLDKGADPNIKNNFNNTALMFALMSSNNKAIEMLLTKDIQLNIINNNDLTALMYAASYNKENMKM